MAGIRSGHEPGLKANSEQPTWPTSMAAVFLRLLAGVYTISTLFNLCPSMEFALTNCRAGHGQQAVGRQPVQGA